MVVVPTPTVAAHSIDELLTNLVAMTVCADVYVIGNVIYFCLIYPLTLSVLQIPQHIFNPFDNINFPDAFCAKVELI